MDVNTFPLYGSHPIQARPGQTGAHAVPNLLSLLPWRAVLAARPTKGSPVSKDPISNVDTVVASHAVPIVKLYLRSMCPLRVSKSSTEACTHGQSESRANENVPVVQTDCNY